MRPQRLTTSRKRDLALALAQLPDLKEVTWRSARAGGGEDARINEAAAWKHLLNWRVAHYLQPARILETHRGRGVSTALYRHACPEAEIIALGEWREARRQTGPFGLIDIDPFGAVWDPLEAALPLLADGGVLLCSNGEALAVWRHLTPQQRYPTAHCGRQMWRWVLEEYLPKLEELTALRVQWFYAYPSTVRVILSRRALPATLWSECPRWMWWLKKCAPESISNQESVIH